MAKVYCSELAVQVVYDAMRLVGVESYTKKTPLECLLQDALVFPLYDGGNMGVRRRQLHAFFTQPEYDSMLAVRGRVPPWKELTVQGSCLETSHPVEGHTNEHLHASESQVHSLKGRYQEGSGLSSPAEAVESIRWAQDPVETILPGVDTRSQYNKQTHHMNMLLNIRFAVSS